MVEAGAEVGNETVSDAMADSRSVFVAAGGETFRDFTRLRTGGIAGPSFAIIFDIDAVTDDFVRFVMPALDAPTPSDELRMPRERVMIAMILTEVVMLCIEWNAVACVGARQGPP